MAVLLGAGAGWYVSERRGIHPVEPPVTRFDTAVMTVETVHAGHRSVFSPLTAKPGDEIACSMRGRHLISARVQPPGRGTTLSADGRLYAATLEVTSRKEERVSVRCSWSGAAGAVQLRVDGARDLLR